MSSTILMNNLQSVTYSAEKVIQSAKKMGFVCQINAQDNWQIFSAHKCENWHLTQLENKWVLSIGGVPQIYRSDREAIAFMESCYQFISQKGVN